jgi:hypothetical protein
MSAAALNKQYGKPLINGLNPEWRKRRRMPWGIPPHCGIPATGSQRMHPNPRVAWNLFGFIVYLWIRNLTW